MAAVKTQRVINEAGLVLIESFEGLRLTAYKDSVGVPTIGYGSTRNVHMGMSITKATAEKLLEADLAVAENGVQSFCKAPLNDNQFAACVSLAFNIGVGAFAKSSILRAINAKDYQVAADHFLYFDEAGGKVLQGLLTRRKAERKLFLTPVQTLVAGAPKKAKAAA